MNPSLKLLLVLIISLEITFTNQFTVNIIIIGVALLLIISQRPKFKSLLQLLLVPAIPAAVLAVTIGCFSPQHSWFFAIVLVTRLYTYCFLGAFLTVTTTPLELARSLEQNAHLPAKFAYGTLAALNLVPRTIQTVKTIRVAGQMRGVTLHFWSPQLYFKAIVATLTWSDDLAQAMESQGFVEGQARTAAQVIQITSRDWFILIAYLAVLQVGISYFP